MAAFGGTFFWGVPGGNLQGARGPLFWLWLEQWLVLGPCNWPGSVIQCAVSTTHLLGALELFFLVVGPGNKYIYIYIYIYIFVQEFEHLNGVCNTRAVLATPPLAFPTYAKAYMRRLASSSPQHGKDIFWSPLGRRALSYVHGAQAKIMQTSDYLQQKSRIQEAGDAKNATFCMHWPQRRL